MGLIGSMIAGAAETTGATGTKIGIDSMQADIQALRDQRIHDYQKELESMREAGADRRLAVTEGGADRRLGVTEAGATARQNAGFTHSENLAAARQAFEAEQNAQQRDLTREQIKAQKEIAAANNATSIKVASIGGTIQQDKDGNVFFFDKTGNAKPIMDPLNPTQPMKGMKDLTPAAKAYVDTIKAQLVSLDRLEAGAMGDQTQLDAIAKRRAELTADQLNVITGGVSEVGKGHTAPAGKAQWNDSTGDVLLDGKKIGTAKSADEARAIIKAGNTSPVTGIVGSKASAAPTVPGRPLYSADQNELKRLASRPKGVSPAQAAEAQDELDRRVGESRISGG